jgi:hypothetical protein
VSKEDEYRKNAAESVELAAKMPTSAAKGRLLRMAEKWLDLAARARWRRHPDSQGLPEHPLLRKKLGPDETDDT